MFLSIPWVPEVFLSCATYGEKLHRLQAEATSGEVTKRTSPKPEVAQGKPLAPRMSSEPCKNIR